MFNHEGKEISKKHVRNSGAILKNLITHNSEFYVLCSLGAAALYNKYLLFDACSIILEAL